MLDNLKAPPMQPTPRRSVFAAPLAVMIVLAAAAPLLAGSATAASPGAANAPSMAGHMMPGHAPPAMSLPDARELVDFPPQMRAHMLANMREHVETLNGVLQALAVGDYDAAARLADAQLGLDSPAAASCKPKEANAPPPAQGSMDAMMALYMPEPMRGIGLEMHSAASQFAIAARSHDAKAAMDALARITPNCVACHAAYRLQ